MIVVLLQVRIAVCVLNMETGVAGQPWANHKKVFRVVGKDNKLQLKFANDIF